MSSVKPILFNTEMVRSILDGRKTCTRRKIPVDIVDFCDIDRDGELLVYENSYGDFIAPERLCRYQPGDILYVRETWKKAPNGYYYYEDWQRNDIADITKWKPSIHMPKEAARIWLKVTSVRIERLQEITEDEAKKEGMPDSLDYPIDKAYCPVCNGVGLLDSHDHDTLGYVETDCENCDTYIKRFKNLWDTTINKKNFDLYGWDADPYVWVIDFERWCYLPQKANAFCDPDNVVKQLDHLCR